MPFQLKQDKYPDPPNADGLNLVTEYRYDNLNRVVQVSNPAGQSIEYTYDDWGNIASTNQVDMGRVDYSISG